MHLCIYLHIWLLKYKRSKKKFSAIFAFTFTHRYAGTNKSRRQNVTFDLAI